MKINDDMKNNTSFLFGKLRGLNNREASRLWMISKEGIEGIASQSNLVYAYIMFCKEPNIDHTKFDNTISKNGEVKKTRSKIVMEYEKHRKLFLSIVNARNNLNIKEQVDKKLLEAYNAPDFNKEDLSLDNKKSLIKRLMDSIK